MKTCKVEINTIGNVEIRADYYQLIFDVMNGDMPAAELTIAPVTDSGVFADLDECDILSKMLMFMAEAEVTSGLYCAECCHYKFMNIESPCLDDHACITLLITYGS